MSRVKGDLTWVSLNQLSELTGKTYRTLKKLLEDVAPEKESGTLFYRASEVLPIIFGSGSKSEEDRKLNHLTEKARYDSLRAEKVGIEIDILREKLIPAERVEKAWTNQLAVLRTRLLTLPTRLSARLVALSEPTEIERIIRVDIYDSLTELSGVSSGDDRTENNEAVPESPSPATKPDSVGVGTKGEKTKP